MATENIIEEKKQGQALITEYKNPNTKNFL